MGRNYRKSLQVAEPCRCDTGLYCHRHMRYRTTPKLLSVAVHTGVYVEHDQRCGGGRRVIRKSTERSA